MRTLVRIAFLSTLSLGMPLAVSAQSPATPVASPIPLVSAAASDARSIVVRAPKRDLRLEIADTFRLRERGLMFRTSVPANGGMIFVFSGNADEPFWMKNTLVSLDMVFVRADGVVSSVASEVPASKAGTTDDKVARRVGFGKYVIELAAGEAAAAGIQRGTHLDISGVTARE